MIHKTQLSVVNKLNLELGIEGTDKWHEYNLVLAHITSYTPFFNDDDLLEADKTVVYDASGMAIIKTSYSFFDKLMQDFYKA